MSVRTARPLLTETLRWVAVDVRDGGDGPEQDRKVFWWATGGERPHCNIVTNRNALMEEGDDRPEYDRKLLRGVAGGERPHCEAVTNRNAPVGCS